MRTLSPSKLSRACLQAYVDKDRAAIEALIADDFSFTSPLDNALDRRTYFARCWPNSVAMAGFDVVHAIDDGDRALVIYEGRTADGKRFRNAEMHTTRDSQLTAVEVYFGWSLPHPAERGGFIDDEGSGPG